MLHRHPQVKMGKCYGSGQKLPLRPCSTHSDVTLLLSKGESSSSLQERTYCLMRGSTSTNMPYAFSQLTLGEPRHFFKSVSARAWNKQQGWWTNTTTCIILAHCNNKIKLFNCFIGLKLNHFIHSLQMWESRCVIWAMLSSDLLKHLKIWNCPSH